MRDLVVGTHEIATKTLDRIGIDIHFTRLLVITVFGERSHLSDDIDYLDLLFIFGIIIPLFVIGLKFWTAPAYLIYNRRMNAFCAPLAMVPIFFADHTDVMLLGILVFLMNGYIFWYHIDPTMDYHNGYRNN